MTAESFLRPQEWAGDSRVLFERCSGQWREGPGCGSGVAISPPEKQGQLLQQVGFAGKSFGGRPKAIGPFVSP